MGVFAVGTRENQGIQGPVGRPGTVGPKVIHRRHAQCIAPDGSLTLAKLICLPRALLEIQAYLAGMAIQE